MFISNVQLLSELPCLIHKTVIYFSISTLLFQLSGISFWIRLSSLGWALL